MYSLLSVIRWMGSIGKKCIYFCRKSLQKETIRKYNGGLEVNIKAYFREIGCDQGWCVKHSGHQRQHEFMGGTS